MDNIPVGLRLDFSTLLWLDNATPEQLLCEYKLIGSQDISTAAGQSAAGQSEVFAQHQVRVSNPDVGYSYRPSYYEPANNEGQMNDCLNTVQEPAVIQRSPLPAGLPSFNQPESKGNSLCCVNDNDPERRVTSYLPDNPTEASPATLAVRISARRAQNKATEQLQKNFRRSIVTTALRNKILSRKSGKSAGITADAGKTLVPESCVKIARGTVSLRKRASTTSSVKSNRANKQRSFR